MFKQSYIFELKNITILHFFFKFVITFIIYFPPQTATTKCDHRTKTRTTENLTIKIKIKPIIKNKRYLLIKITTTPSNILLISFVKAFTSISIMVINTPFVQKWFQNLWNAEPITIIATVCLVLICIYILKWFFCCCCCSTPEVVPSSPKLYRWRDRRRQISPLTFSDTGKEYRQF